MNAPAPRTVDVNCDLGESFGVYRYGADEEVMPLITSANVACGAHAGDPRTMRQSIELAARHGVAVGAHVGLADREGFGRRMIPVSAQEVYDLCLAQMGSLEAFLRAAGQPMAHLKPHGALYMMVNDAPELAQAVCTAVTDFDPALAIYALPGSALAAAARSAGLRVVEEFFADRPYHAGAVRMFGWSLQEIGSPQEAAERTLHQLATATFADVGTLCVHSDTPAAAARLTALRRHLSTLGWTVSAPQTAPRTAPQSAPQSVASAVRAHHA
ncbi:5-oxoprolinase subunit PxpA [Kineococcus sp. SYSU DK006]|uniref:5-oxoprolinase subunit PxpA n=1 Tax=Kineococcus sp. SYSU DK006 TaxID=3383127 RepID=UPI003D7E302A